ncbi:basic blue protein-like [Oryza brachyantha]|uniref:Phytocyanin domain-containing protein n=1 Tax=Oryza brachyantha TaxID=4533 RepID=J3N7V9_ORYBR|nr:basic blue protein-like [Oryza brachyantha]
MGRGGCCASSLLAVWLVVVVCSTTAAAAESHVVGDTKGWGFSVAYDGWASGKIFAAGDTLVFNYQPGVHNVVAVSAAEYRSWKVRDSADAAATAAGSARLDLKKGANYFICGLPGHCAAGMKLRVVAN